MKINKKYLGRFGLVLIASYLTACDGETKNPATTDRDELNPPGSLISLTQDGSVELRWVDGNAEEDFKGYYVFATETTLGNLDTLGAGGLYPTSSVLAKGAQVPRCLDNSKVFEKFGFPASDKDCSGADETTTDTPSTLTSQLSEETEPEEKLANFVKCEGQPADAKVSLPLEPKKLGVQRCVVKQFWNGSALANIENGKTYVFVVAAVMGDDLKNISWTSNFIEDAPSKDSFKSTTAIDLSTIKYRVLSIDSTTFVASLGDEVACPNLANSPCKVSVKNQEAANGIYIGRDTSAKLERIFVSTSEHANSKFDIEEITVMSADPNNASDKTTPQVRFPGDEPSLHTFNNKGTTFQVLANSIFDVRMTNGANTHYGKIAFGSITYEGTAKDSKAMIDVTVVMQPGAGVPHYFQ